MNRPQLHATLSVLAIVLLLSSLSLAQITNEDLLQELENRSLPAFLSSIIDDNNLSANLRDDDDLLIGERHDDGDGANWISEDSIEYYHQIITSTLKSELLESSLQIFPSPSNGQLTIEFSKYDVTSGDVHIYNSIGQLVYSQFIQNGDHKKLLDLSGFSEGTYFLQIVDGDKQTSQAFMIAH